MLAYPSRHHLPKRRRREIHQQRNAGFSVHSNLDLDISVPDSDGGGNARVGVLSFVRLGPWRSTWDTGYLEEVRKWFVKGVRTC